MEIDSFGIRSGRDLSGKVEEVSKLEVEEGALKLRCHMTTSTISLFTHHFLGPMMPYLDRLTIQDGWN